MKIEIYQTENLQPLTTVECDKWEFDPYNVPRIKLYKDKGIVAMFFVKNIAGFKELESDAE